MHNNLSGLSAKEAENSKYSDLWVSIQHEERLLKYSDSHPTHALIRVSPELFVSVCVSVYKEVDLLLKSNHSEHHTADISADQLIVRRGQSFNVSLTLAQPFNGDLHPLSITVTTGETFQRVFVDWRAGLLEGACPVVTTDFTSC